MNGRSMLSSSVDIPNIGSYVTVMESEGEHGANVWMM